MDPSENNDPDLRYHKKFTGKARRRNTNIGKALRTVENKQRRLAANQGASLHNKTRR